MTNPSMLVDVSIAGPGSGFGEEPAFPPERAGGGASSHPPWVTCLRLCAQVPQGERTATLCGASGDLGSRHQA